MTLTLVTMVGSVPAEQRPLQQEDGGLSRVTWQFLPRPSSRQLLIQSSG